MRRERVVTGPVVDGSWAGDFVVVRGIGGIDVTTRRGG
jgi:hypothetical protein